MISAGIALLRLMTKTLHYLKALRMFLIMGNAGFISSTVWVVI